WHRIVTSPTGALEVELVFRVKRAASLCSRRRHSDDRPVRVKAGRCLLRHVFCTAFCTGPSVLGRGKAYPKGAWLHETRWPVPGLVRLLTGRFVVGVALRLNGREGVVSSSLLR